MANFLEILNEIATNPTATKPEYAPRERISSLTPEEAYQIAADQRVHGITPDNYIPTDPFAGTDRNQLRNIMEGATQFYSDRNRIYDRSTLQRINDLSGQAVAGIESLGYIPAGTVGLAQDLVNTSINLASGSDLPTNHTAENLQAVSDLIDSTLEWGTTPAAQARQRAIAAEALARQRANERQYNKDILSGKNKTVATLNKVGREVLDTLDQYSEGEELSNLTANALGQLGGQSVATRLASKAILNNAAQRTAEESSREFLKKYGVPSGSKTTVTPESRLDNNLLMANIGLSEAGAGAAQVNQEIDDMSIRELYFKSPEFYSLVQERIAQGNSKEDAEKLAKEDLKGIATRRAYTLSIPASLAASRFATRYVNDPLGRRVTGNLRTNLAETVGEGVEETSTNVASGLINNTVAQATYDMTRGITDNMGQNIVEGSIGGLAPATTLRAPSFAVGAVSSTVGPTVNAIRQGVNIAAQTKAGQKVGQTVSNAASAAVNKVGDTFEEHNRSKSLNKAAETVNKYASNLKETQETVSEPETQTDTSTQTQDISSIQKYVDAINLYQNSKDGSDERLKAAKDIESYSDAVYKTLEANLSEKDKTDFANNLSDAQDYIKKYTTKQAENTLKNPKEASETQIENVVNKLPDIDPDGSKSNELLNNSSIELSEKHRKAIQDYTKIISEYKKRANSINSNRTKEFVENNLFSAEDAKEKGKDTYYSAKEITDNITKLRMSSGFMNEDQTSLQEYEDWLHRFRNVATSIINRAQAMTDSLNHGPDKNGKYPEIRRNTFNSKDQEEYTTKKGVFFSNTPKGRQLYADVLRDAENYANLYNTFVSTVYNTQGTIDLNTLPKAPKDFSPDKEYVYITREVKDSPSIIIIDPIKSRTRKENTNISPNSKDITSLAQNEINALEGLIKENPNKESKVNDLKEVLQQYSPLIQQANKDMKSLSRNQRSEYINLRKKLTSLFKDLDIEDSSLAKRWAKYGANTTNIENISKEQINETLEPVKIRNSNDIISNNRNTLFTFIEDSTNKIASFRTSQEVVDFISKAIDKDFADGNIDSSTKNKLHKALSSSSENYTAFFNNLESYLSGSNLKALSEAIKNKGLSAVIKYQNYRILNFAEQVNENTWQIRDSDKAKIYLATIQFINELGNYTNNIRNNLDYLITSQNINTSTITDEQFNIISSGVEFNSLVPALASKLRDYLGFKSNPNISISYNGDTALNALSLQLLKNLQDLGVIKINNLDLNTLDGKVKSFRFVDINPKSSSQFKEQTRLYGLAKNYIQKTLVPNSYHEYFGNDSMPDINQISKLRTGTRYTKKELKAIENMRKTKYYINPQFRDVLQQLEAKGLISLFSTDIDPHNEKVSSSYNVNTLNSIVGKNISINNSFDINMTRYDEAFASCQKQGLDEAFIRIDYRMTSAGRMQEQLAYGPSADKLSRQLFTNTHSIVDSNNQNQKHKWNLALCQAFDMKLKHYAPDYIDSVADKIIDTIKNSNLYKEQAYTVSSVRELFNAIGKVDPSLSGDISYLGLNAITNAIKLIDSKDGKFLNTLSLELDASTAGTTNSIAKFAAGLQHTVQELKAIARGGFHIGNIITNYEYYSKYDKEDNYTNSAKFTNQKIRNKLNYILNRVPDSDKSSEEDTYDLIDAVFNLSSLFVDGFNSTGSVVDNSLDITIKRKLVKDPATRINYYQQKGSATSQFVERIVFSIYDHMSTALAHKNNDKLSLAEKFFYNEGLKGQEAQVAFNKVITDLNNLLNIKLLYSRKGDNYFTEEISGEGIDIGNYLNDINQYKSFSYDAIASYFKENIESNFRQILVEPMYDAIIENRGHNFDFTAKNIIASTELMSLVQNSLIKDEITSYREKNHELPSNKQLNTWITGKYGEGYGWSNPRVSLGNTYIDLAGTETYRNDKNQSVGKVESLKKNKSDTSLSYANNIYIPGDPGVSPIATMVIASSDGEMQTDFFSQYYESAANRYDGVDIDPLMLEDYGEAINKSAYEVLLDNPISDLAKKFSLFKERLSDLSKQDMENFINRNSDTLVYLYNQHHSAKETIVEEDLDPKLISKFINEINTNLTDASNLVEAKIIALKQIPISVQHMTSTSEPEDGYIVNRQGIEKLEAYLQEHNFADTFEQRMQGITNYFNSLVQKNYYEITNNNIKAYRDNTDAEKRLNISVSSGEEFKSLISKKLKSLNPDIRNFVNNFVTNNLDSDTSVIIGTRDNLRNYFAFRNESEVVNSLKISSNSGIYRTSNNTIILVQKEGKSNAEALAHELIHAVTARKIAELSKYTKESEVPVKDRTSWKALQVMNGLFEDFLNLNLEGISSLTEEQKALFTERKKFLVNMANADRVTALKEFTAYALTETNLRKVLGNTQVKQMSNPNIFVSLAKSVAGTKLVNKIKSIADAFTKVVFKFLGIKDRYSMQSFMQAMEFSTGILIQNQEIDTSINTSEELLKFSENHFDDFSHARQVAGNLARAMRKNIRMMHPNYRKAASVDLRVRSSIADEVTPYGDTLNSMVQAGFDLNQKEKQLMKIIMTAFDTSYALNPTLKIEAENFRTLVLSKLGIENFISEPEQGKEQRVNNMLSYLISKDTSLAAFMALGMVNSELRNALDSIDITKKDVREFVGTDIDSSKSIIDSYLNTLGSRTIEFIGNTLAKKSNSSNAKKILDTYVETLAQTGKDLSFLNIPTTFLNSADAFVSNLYTKGMQGIVNSDWFHKFLKADINNTIAKGLAKSLGITVAELNPEVLSKQVDKVRDYVNAYAAKNNTFWGNILMWMVKELAPVDADYDAILRAEKESKSVVQNARQTYREYIPNIIRNKFKKELGRELTRTERKNLNEVINKGDLGVLSDNDVKTLLSSKSKLEDGIIALEERIVSNLSEGSIRYKILEKAQQYANFMLTGNAGRNLLRNATAISRLYGEVSYGYIASNKNQVIKDIDKLITLYYLSSLDPGIIDTVYEIYTKAPESFKYSLAQQRALRTKEEKDALSNELTAVNYYKGNIPYSNLNGASVRLVQAEEISDYKNMGYIVIGKYRGPKSTKDKGQVYMANAYNPKMTYNQGMLQAVVNQAGGLDVSTGNSTTGIVGIIKNPKAINYYMKHRAQDIGNTENFIVQYAPDGSVISLERSVNPEMYKSIRKEEDFAQVLGNWKGRQIEEDLASKFNANSLDILNSLYEKDKNTSRKNQWINAYGLAESDAVVRDSINMLSSQVKEMIKERFGEDFFPIRRDMLDDILGHRRASITDAFTGVTRLSSDSQKLIREGAKLVFGDKAFMRLTQGERGVMFTISSARNWIVVRSFSVMFDNLVSNFAQLVVRGVSPVEIVRQIPGILREVEAYNTYRMRKAQIEADINALAGSPSKNDQYKRKVLEAKLQGLEKSLNNLTSIKPLLDAGEYNTIADIGDTSDDILMSTGRWGEWLDNKINKLPKQIRTAGRYLAVTKDTALYRGLEKGVQYGDFIAKVIMFNHLKKQGKSVDEALRTVRYEFVNYDMLGSRTREYLENIGLLWFYNYKLRTTRVFFSMMYNNPVHSLLFMMMPFPIDIGSPLTDNFLSKIMSGGITGSMGPGLLLDTPSQNIWYQMFM